MSNSCIFCLGKGEYLVEHPVRPGVPMQGPLLCPLCGIEQIKKLQAALKPLVAIADAYDANNLDDEARKFWGLNLENENTRPPRDVELYCGRGGKQLLTLAHCLVARRVVQETQHGDD